MTDWDLVWRWERVHRAHAPVDFRRWKRASQRTLRERFPGEGVRVLDATAGLGDHAVNLAELGFVVDACDASAEARDATREAVRAAGVDVEVFDARWEELGDRRADRYDLIFHDALHWIDEPDAMHAALRGLRGALRPGGALVFFFADPEKRAPGAGLENLEWDRRSLRDHELAWDHPIARGSVTHVRTSIAHERTIEDRLLWIVREDDRARVESTTLRRIYRWDWHAMEEATARAGFTALDGLRFTSDKGHTTPMCFARR